MANLADVVINPIRVAHIMGKMASGGVEAVVMNYYRHIDRTKVQFDFIIDEDSTVVPYDEIESMGGRVYKVPPYQKPAAYHSALVGLFRGNKYSIVHSHINTLSIFPLFAAMRADVPVRIAHNHSTAGKGETARNILKYILRPFAKLFPTHYCACSKHVGRWLFGNKSLAKGRVTIINNAIDTSKFIFSKQIRENVRKELNIENKFVVGHVGRFVKTKNHLFLVDIFDQIRVRNPDSTMLLVGEGELEQKTRDRVKELGLTEHIRFLGVRNDVHRLLMAMDVFLLPSLYEGLPVVGVEAQISGLKTLVSDTTTREAEVLEDGIEFMSLNQSTEEWAARAISFRPVDREKIAEIAAVAGYDIGLAADKLCKYYMKLFDET